MISQWSERGQRLLQPQWERLWTHSIFFPRYRLCVWVCACTCVCVCLCLTGLFPSLNGHLWGHCALVSSVLPMLHWTQGHGTWRTGGGWTSDKCLPYLCLHTLFLCSKGLLPTFQLHLLQAFLPDKITQIIWLNCFLVYNLSVFLTVSRLTGLCFSNVAVLPDLSKLILLKQCYCNKKRWPKLWN